MNRVLFVDDEPRVLDGLRRAMRRERKRWEMEFAVGGREALAAIDVQPFDVVVSDMRMPGMDGIALLDEVRLRSPESVRVILSGHTDFDAVLKAVPLAHQFLAKPCDIDALKLGVERALSAGPLLGDGALRQAIGQMSSAPIKAEVIERLRTALEDPEISAEILSRIVEDDLGLAAKLLQLVNSSFFGLGRPICGVTEAIEHLGANALDSLLRSDCLVVRGGAPNDVDRRSRLTARIAAEFAGGGPLGDVAFTAGLLHDIGLVVLDACGRHLDQADHTDVGRYFASLCGLPPLLGEAIGAHHQPGDHAADEFVVAAVHVSAHLVEGRTDFDEAYLERMGIECRLQQWQALAESYA